MKNNLATVGTPGVRYENREVGKGKVVVKGLSIHFGILLLFILFCFCNENMFMYPWYNFKTKPKQNDAGL